MANCRSAQAGGIMDSVALDFFREVYDNVDNALRKKADPNKMSPCDEMQDSLDDMRADLEGLKNGLNPFQDCSSKCAGLL